MSIYTDEQREQARAALKAARTDRGLSLREFQAVAGIPYTVLSELENGKRLATRETVAKLAKNLNLDVAILDPLRDTEVRRRALNAKRSNVTVNTLIKKGIKQYWLVSDNGATASAPYTTRESAERVRDTYHFTKYQIYEAVTEVEALRLHIAALRSGKI